MANVSNNTDTEETKMLGGQVPMSLYWEFKKKAADRKETMIVAIENAARLYIDLEPNEEELEARKGE